MKKDTSSKGTKQKSQNHHGYKSIRLPFSEDIYDKLLENKKYFKMTLNQYITEYPWLFPKEIKSGFSLYGYSPESIKLGIKVRRIVMNSTDEIYQIYPSYVMPYMTEETKFADKFLLLSLYKVPNWVIAHIFEKDEKHIERMVTHLGKCNLVGSTVSGKIPIPVDVIADEKHSWKKAEKCYIATIAAENVFLGANVSEGADEVSLQQAYSDFKNESHDTEPNYTPRTVNTDGWFATGNAFKNLFSQIKVIFCFLHALLSIKNVVTSKTMHIYERIQDMSWNIYRSKDKHTFAQRIRRLREWISDCSDSKIKEKVLKLCKKKANFMQCFDYEYAYRTSNMIDRLMDFMDKFLYIRKYFHGSTEASNNVIKSFCLAYNFKPYSPKTRQKKKGKSSAFEQLNGFCYHQNWLQNMLIATSRNGFRNFQQKKT